MSHWVAVEWDDTTLRVLCVRPTAGTLVIEHRFSLPLPEVDGEPVSHAGLPAAFLPRLAGALAPALAERGIRRGELLVAMGRSGVELRTIEVPTVPENELPELVRMQATQIFHVGATPPPIDYVPIDFGEEKITVLAASLAPDVYEGLKGLAEALKLKLGCVTLRTVSAARLLAYCGRHPGESLVICRSQEQVDLVAMLEGRPVFVRNTRIPGESIDAGLALEVRRTLLAIASRHSDENVDRLVLWGSERESGAIAETLRQRLSMEVEVLDPFSAEQVEAPGLAQTDDAGSYASLVGMLCEHRRPPHAIDFRNPKRAVEPSRVSPRMLLYGGAAAALALILLTVFGWRLWSLSSEIAGLETEIQNLQALKVKADEVVERTDWVRGWTEEDYVWLDELRVVSERMPAPEQAIVREWTSVVDSKGAGMTRLTVHVDDHPTIGQAEYGLRDEFREVVSSGDDPDESIPGYGYRTRTSISLARPVPLGADDVADAAGTSPDDSTSEPLADEDADDEGDDAPPEIDEALLDPALVELESDADDGSSEGSVDEAGDSEAVDPAADASSDLNSDEAADEPAADAPLRGSAPSSTPSSTGANR